MTGRVIHGHGYFKKRRKMLRAAFARLKTQWTRVCWERAWTTEMIPKYWEILRCYGRMQVI